MTGGSSNEVLISNLDPGNPLHLNNNDFSISTIISMKLTGTENYRFWATAMKLTIHTRNKTGFIDGTCKKDAYESSVPLSNQLKETYDKLDGSVLFNIMQKIHSFKQGDLSVSECYHKLNSFWREFDILTKLPNLLTRETLPTIKDAFNIISKEESHRGIPFSSIASVSKSQVSSFVSETKFSNTKNSNGHNLNLTCKNHGKDGHTIERYFDIIGCPPSYIKPSFKPGVKSGFNAIANADISQSNSSRSSLSLSFTNDQMMKLMAPINDVPSGNIQANMAGWIIDSGANQHMIVRTKNMFGIIDISDLYLTVGHPNGTLAKIKYVGNMQLSNNVVLYDVLVVPEYCVSLLSVYNLIRDSRMSVGFDENKCYIHDLTQNRIIGTGNETGGLYLFDKHVCKSLGKNVSIVAYVSKTLWHNRLVILLTRAKQTREPFPFSDHKSSVVGDLIHLIFGALIGSASNNNDVGYNVPTVLFPTENNDDVQLVSSRKSGRSTKMPSKLNDYVVNSSKKYRLEKVVKLVAKGFSQKEGIDYEETFSHVFKMTIVRCLINIDVQNDWPLYQLDVNNVSLYGDLSEDVYMTMPPGFNGKDGRKVCKLNKSLYGLKQAPKQWNSKLVAALTDHDFVQSKFDYSLFTKDLVLIL
ncbi:ribonuclease H-like domain-containing protein [Tanacetum coccineum]